MKSRLRFCASIALLCWLLQGRDLKAQATSSAPPAALPSRTQTPEGSWAGSLQVGDTVLHFILHIGKTEYGASLATLDSLDQGVYGIEAGSLTESGSSLKFEIPSVNASYAGEVSADHRSIDGTWSQGGASLPLIFHRQPRIAISRTPTGAVATAEGTWQGALETNGIVVTHNLRDFQRVPGLTCEDWSV